MLLPNERYDGCSQMANAVRIMVLARSFWTLVLFFTTFGRLLDLESQLLDFRIKNLDFYKAAGPENLAFHKFWKSFGLTFRHFSILR
jgi:hypothetical protein